MKWERWEMRSTEITLHFLLWNQKTKSLITLSVSNQSSATGEKAEMRMEILTMAQYLIIFLDPFSSSNFHLTLLLPVSLFLVVFFWLYARLYAVPSIFGWNVTWLFYPSVVFSIHCLYPVCATPDKIHSHFHAALWPWLRVTGSSHSTCGSSDTRVGFWDYSNKPCRAPAHKTSLFSVILKPGLIT